MITLKEQLSVLGNNFVELFQSNKSIAYGYSGYNGEHISSQFDDYLNKEVITINVCNKGEGWYYEIVIAE